MNDKLTPSALPLTAVVDQLFGTMKRKGWGGEDHSALLRLLEDLSDHRAG